MTTKELFSRDFNKKLQAGHKVQNQFGDEIVFDPVWEKPYLARYVEGMEITSFTKFTDACFYLYEKHKYQEMDWKIIEP